MDKKHYDLWAEVPSPIKSRLRNVFSACAEELNAYIPAQVGGNMTKEEYLKENGNKLIDFVLSEEGQNIVEENGLIRIK